MDSQDYQTDKIEGSVGINQFKPGVGLWQLEEGEIFWCMMSYWPGYTH